MNRYGADLTFLRPFFTFRAKAKASCTSKPGITNSVLKAVNPDLVSYSSYTATNGYAETGDTAAVDALLVSTLDHVQAQLTDKPATLGFSPLGFEKRVFIGEFGACFDRGPPPGPPHLGML